MHLYNEVIVTPWIALPSFPADSVRRFQSYSRPCGVPLGLHRLVISLQNTLRFYNIDKRRLAAAEEDLDFTGSIVFSGEDRIGNWYDYRATFAGGKLTGIELQQEEKSN